MAQDKDDEPVAGAGESGGGAADPFSPPERRSGPGRNWMMLGVLIIVVLALVAFVITLAT